MMDWSSDVCSADLAVGVVIDDRRITVHGEARQGHLQPFLVLALEHLARLAESVIALGLGTQRRPGEIIGRGVGKIGADVAVAARGIDRLLLLPDLGLRRRLRSAEHTSELQSLMRISYAVFCLKKKKKTQKQTK